MPHHSSFSLEEKDKFTNPNKTVKNTALVSVQQPYVSEPGNPKLQIRILHCQLLDCILSHHCKFTELLKSITVA